MRIAMPKWVLITMLVLVSPVMIYGCASSQTDQSTGQFVDDSAITAKVKAKLFEDPATSGFQINVTTFKRVVQLSGFVNDDASKARAGELAQSVPDVRDVENNVTVKPTS